MARCLKQTENAILRNRKLRKSQSRIAFRVGGFVLSRDEQTLLIINTGGDGKKQLANHIQTCLGQY